MNPQIRRVAHINTEDRDGGAAKIAWQLTKGFLDVGIESRLFVGYKHTDSQLSEKIRYFPLERSIEKRFAWHVGVQDTLFPSTWRSLRLSWLENSDTIHIHNLHGGYFALPALISLTARKPAVWTLHDFWSLTGKCVVPLDCERWKVGCGQCPQVSQYPAMRVDTTALLYRWKRMLYQRIDLTLVVPSLWMKQQVQEAELPWEVVYIPHGIDTHTFSPQPKDIARDQLGLPQEMRLILFVAASVEDSRKGMNFLMSALNHLSSYDVGIIAIGKSGPDQRRESSIPVFRPGYINDEQTLALYYSAADVFVNPTLSETAGLTNVEAMACGTPVVAFRSGAVPEYVIDGKTGLLVDPGDIDGLVKAISTLLLHADLAVEYGAQASEHAQRNFSLELFLQRHLALYRDLVTK